MQELSTDQRLSDHPAIRLFLVDDKTGAPVPGVVISITAGLLPKGDSDLARQQTQHLATLQTDHVGYASFKLDRSITTSPRLTISYGSTPDAALVLNVADILSGYDTYRLRIDPSVALIAAPQLGLPSVISPDLGDLAISPASIALIPRLAPPGLCAQLMPTTLAARRFRIVHILADICTPEVLSCPPGERPNVGFVRGKMREYEVTWHPRGTSLGELLNTITLSPCEQVNVAISDWTRREVASRSEVSELQQQAWQRTDHDRLITEVLHSSVHGSAVVAAIGVSASVPIDTLTLGFGGGVSGSVSSQTTALTTTNQLSEHITQAASFVAHRRSSVVFQVTASEQQHYQTRTVRNHNHCHTLTLMYFQINRHYRVVTDYKGEREVILVKYGNPDFDAKRAYCNAHPLKAVLLDPSLRDCFDKLPDALFCCDEKMLPKDLQMISVTIAVKVRAKIRVNNIVFVLNTPNGPISLPPINAGGWQSGGTYTQTVNVPAGVDPKQVTSMQAHLFNGGGLFGGPRTLILSEIKITYHAFGYDDPLPLYSSQAETVITLGWQVPINVELPVPDTEIECIEASCCAKKLIGHLNCHKYHYNRIVWLNEDPDDRIMRWSCCSRAGTPFSLIDEIENVPVTVYGDFVVFPAAGSQLVDDPSILPVSKLVTLPTPGVYSEGILGQCDTCETIDTTKFWNWKDSPCPDSAPVITNLPTPTTGTKPEDLKPEVISNLISFSAIPEAPNSIVKDLVTSLLANADGGSKEAKALLEKLLDSIKAGVSAKK